MGGPSTHGQRNKAHKAGRKAGPSARDKHRQKKDGGGPASTSRASIKAGTHSGKLQRAQAAKQQRDTKRQALLESRRRNSAPLVVALLPLTAAADAQHTWSGLMAAAAAAGGSASGSSSSMATVVAHGRHKVRLTVLKPPADREDPLAIVDLAKAADVLLLLLSGSATAAAVDAAGSSNLAVLRALGLPTCVAVVSSTQQPSAQQQHNGLHAAADADLMDESEDPMAIEGIAAAGAAAAKQPSSAGLKQRSAAKKRAEKALQQHLPGDIKLLSGDTPQDMQQLLRVLADTTPQLPVWRRQRPYLLVQQAAFVPTQQQPEQQGAVGELRLTGYVRAQGLSANQLVTVPGAGDFQILRIEAAEEASPLQQQQHPQRQRKGAAAAGGDMDMADAAGAGAGAAGRVLALPDAEQQEQLVRENEPDPLAGEQTWPTEEELSAAAAAAAASRRMRKRRLPAGTSEYQAAWILDDDEDGSEVSDGSEDDFDDYAMDGDHAEPPPAAPLHDTMLLGEGGAAGDVDLFDAHTEGGEDDGMEYGALMDADEEAEQDAARRLQEELKQKRLAEAEDAEFPDEVDTPQDVAARVRFAKYRGLKSFRSSPWDAREGLPAEYGRVFAFENFKRTAKRAREAAARCTSGADPCSVLPGSYVTLVLANVPAAAAAAVVQRTAAAGAAAAAAADDDVMLDAVPAAAGGCRAPVPLVVFGLLQHEGKLSVLNFGLKKVAGYEESIRNKEQLLFVTGVRSFLARPVLSDDGQGADKHKMERFMQAGGSFVGSVYGPISYPPLPLLAFRVGPGGVTLAAAGALRSVDPDRLVIKKIVLSGYPVRVHKTRAVVRLMFFNPDDVRWFKPLELWTKSGRRGRITEPLGTHGAFKARFDGPISQRDAVCISLYKRVFPKWPAAPAVAAGAWQQQLQQQQHEAADANNKGGSVMSFGGAGPPALGMNSFA